MYILHFRPGLIAEAQEADPDPTTYQKLAGIR